MSHLSLLFGLSAIWIICLLMFYGLLWVKCLVVLFLEGTGSLMNMFEACCAISCSTEIWPLWITVVISVFRLFGMCGIL